MNAKQKIQAKVKETYDDNSPNVYKGTDYDGTIQATGWWYKPFNSTPIFLGKSESDAIDFLEQVADSDEL